MSDEPKSDEPMPRAYAPFWIGLSAGGSLFLVGFMLWAVMFGIGGGPAPNQQQASRAPTQQQTTGQAPAAQPMQQPAQQPEKK